MFQSIVRKIVGSKNERDLKRLWPLVEAGALLQVNVCSLLGRQGPEARAA